jgi:epoxyqueuosine reductase
MLTLPYSNRSSPSLPTGFGQVARYASGSVDYHDSIHHRLKNLGKWLEQKASDVIWRGVVDTAPLLEREFAELAGLGWIGKNTLLLNRQLGSYFFLASLLTNLPLPCDEPNQTDHCGTCRACLDACPTEAFPEPHVLDARRCISYLTIEQRGMPDRDLRSGIGNWLFGCDICQQVCPWNSKSPSVIDPEFIFREEIGAMNLTDLLQMDDERFRNLFRHTPFWRSKRRGLIRNAAIVAGNQKALTCIPHLIQLLQDNEELIRAASVWALLQMPTPEVTLNLQQLALTESHPLVLEELRFLPATN